MSGATIYIRQTDALNMPLNWSYVKNVSDEAKLYVNIPLIPNTNRTVRILDRMVYCSELPISIYEQALANAETGETGEYEATNTANLPFNTDVLNAIQQNPTLSGLVSVGDSLAEMASAILTEGYLISFENRELFNNNIIDAMIPNTVLVDSALSPYAVTDEDVIFVNPNSADTEILLPNLVDATANKQIKIIYDKGDFNAIIKTIGGVDLVGGLTSQSLRVTGHSLTVQVNKLSSPNEYTIIQDSRGIKKQEVAVYKASDLGGALSSSVVYVIDGQIDMGDTTITVPNGGLTFSGEGFNVSSLFSSENDYTMFIGEAAGDVFFTGRGVTITADGTGSKVFNLVDSDGSHATEFNNVNFINCTSLGRLDGYRQGLLRNTFFFGCSEGFTLAGSCSGWAISDTLVLNHGAGDLFTGDAGLSFSGRFVSSANVNLAEASSIAYNFSEISFDDGNFLLQDGRFSGAGTSTLVPPSSVKAKFTNNFGIRDTYIGGKFAITTEATTVITTSNTFVKMAGVTTSDNLEWFDTDGGVNNRLRYIGASEQSMFVTGVLTFTGGNNDQLLLVIRQYDNTDTLVKQSDEFRATLNGGLFGTRAEGLKFQDYFDTNNGDYFEVWIANGSDTSNITGVEEGNLIIKVR